MISPNARTLLTDTSSSTTMQGLLEILGCHTASDQTGRVASLRDEMLLLRRKVAEQTVAVETRASEAGIQAARCAYTVAASDKFMAAGISRSSDMGEKIASRDIDALLTELEHLMMSEIRLVREARRLVPGISLGSVTDAADQYLASVAAIRAAVNAQRTAGANLKIGQAGAAALEQAITIAVTGDMTQAQIVAYRLAADSVKSLREQKAAVPARPEVISYFAAMTDGLRTMAKAAEMGDLSTVRARGKRVIEMVRGRP